VRTGIAIQQVNDGGGGAVWHGCHLYVGGVLRIGCPLPFEHSGSFL
jgi:hypothetical protein